MDESQNSRLYAVVSGRVQGVGYRYFVQQTAHGLGLTGWVRNLRSGEVEVTAEGERAPLERLLAALQRGPSGARVQTIDPDWLPATGEFQDFRVKMTA